jgi:hypothetical protein
MQRRYVEAAVLTVVGLGLAYYCEQWLLDPWKFRTAGLLDGSEARPFVYRQLVPLLLVAVTNVTGASWQVAALWLLRLSCVGWLWALRWLAGAVLPKDYAFLAASSGPIFFVPFVVGTFGLWVYDVPGLALFTLGLAFLAHHRWALYYALLPVGLLNRETAALLIMVYALYAQPHLGRRRFYLALAYQGGAVVVVKLFLAWRYAANFGAVFYNYLPDHINFLVDQPLVTGLIGGSLIVALVIIIRHFRRLPPFVQAMCGLIPVSFFNYFAFVWVVEFRALLDLAPLLAVLAGAIACQRASRDKAMAPGVQDNRAVSTPLKEHRRWGT